MKQGSELFLGLKEALIVHQNLPKRRLPNHVHDRHEVIIPLAGIIKVACAHGVTLQARRGEMAFLPAGASHSYEVKGADAEQVILLFETKWLDSSYAIAPAILQNSVLVAELCLLLLTEEKVSYESSVQSTLKIAVLRSIRTAQSIQPLSQLRPRIRDERLRKAVAHMEKNFAEERVIQDSAIAAAASPRTLTRLFTSELGITAGDVLRNLRIAHAKKLLKAGSYSVTEVALDCGYQSMSQFISNFKNATGTLPSQYKRK